MIRFLDEQFQHIGKGLKHTEFTGFGWAKPVLYKSRNFALGIHAKQRKKA